MRRYLYAILAFVIVSLFAMVSALAAPPPSSDASAEPSPANAPGAYQKFIVGLASQPGLFTLWRKDGKVYMELAKNQLDTDFIETSTPATGMGGIGVTPGNPYYQFARIIRFSRRDDNIVITFPNTSFVAPDGSPAALAIEQNFPPSVLGIQPIIATDPSDGNVLIDASPFLGDVADIEDGIRGISDNPQSQYHLDRAQTYFGDAKAFPDNIIIEADQTWVTGLPDPSVDNLVDPRSFQLKMKYNISTAPPIGSYVPRIADDRVGYYPVIMLNYGDDITRERQLRYIMRWDLRPTSTSSGMAQASNPMIYYLSNTIPFEFRQPVRDALLTWNKAFEKIGIKGAVVVRDEPSDPNWDPDDIRVNVVHWLTQAYNGGYAQAGTVYDPRTGQILKTSIVIDSDLVRFGALSAMDFIAPTLDSSAENEPFASERAYGEGERASALFALNALNAMGTPLSRAQTLKFSQDFLESIVLHESGHEWGLEHNFIGSEAYTAIELQDKSFTSRYGITSSVMEYTPVNLWPHGTPQANFFQNVLGPYDYYAIHWGYARVPGANSPQAEVPTLSRWAQAWQNPWYRFDMDEDVAWGNAHAIDPRVNQFDLSNDNIGWCDAQIKIADDLIAKVPSRFTHSGDTRDGEEQAFLTGWRQLARCVAVANHYVGGEFVSRAHVGDPGAPLPLTSVSRTEARRAFDVLDRRLLGASAFAYSPQTLRQMVYTEWVTDFPQPLWAYNPPLRHDIPIANLAETLQSFTLTRLFQPTMLQRLDDLSLKYPTGSTMSLSDLFAWTQDSVFRDLRTGGGSNEIHRSIQQWYAHKLAQIVLAPMPGTPYDAQSLARAELVDLQSELQSAHGGDTLAAAHIASLKATVNQALDARIALPAGD
jgi:uncharacterized protein DUF4953/uncharacterized protein DUF5117